MLYVFGNSADIGNDGYKVMIAIPARNNVEMEMVSNAGSGNRTDITSDIEAIRVEMFFKNLCGFLDSVHKSIVLFHYKFGETAYMTNRSNEQMAVCIRETIKKHQR